MLAPAQLPLSLHSQQNPIPKTETLPATRSIPTVITLILSRNPLPERRLLRCWCPNPPIVQIVLMEYGTVEKLKRPIESLEQLNLEVDPGSSAQNLKGNSSGDDDDLWCEDGSFYDGSNDGLTKASELEREWKWRHNQFYTVGYRDGLIAGKEAAAQEGFNVGFKQSVLVGKSWGLVRGVTSALACLPDDLKEKLVGKPETRDRFQILHESVHSISSKDALKLFHDDILSSTPEQSQNKGNVDVDSMQSGILECNQLGRFSRELECLLQESPPIEVHAAADRQMVTIVPATPQASFLVSFTNFSQDGVAYARPIITLR